MSLKERLLKRSTLKSTAVFAEQELFQFDKIPTEVPLINLALTGKFDEGVTPGLTVLAAPSKHFKSMLGLVMVSAYLKKYDDAVCLFVDSEFGASKQYFKNAGIDPERVIHIPVLNVEEAKFELTAQLDEIQKGDHVIIFMDSIGNLASKKEADDALDQKSVADMGRAKQIKSLFRIITPHLTLKNIPMVAINHTIQTMEMFSKTVMTSGTGVMYSSNTVLFVTKAQEKEGTELVGYNFTLKAEKSRFIKEGSKLPLTVTFDKGINKYSGLFDLALELGFIHKNSAVSYSRVFFDKNTGELVPEDKKWRRKEADCKEFWEPMLNDEYFKETVEKHYLLDAPTFSTSEADELVSEDE